MKNIHPVTVLFLAAAPILAASATVFGALCMSLAVIGVMLCSLLLLAPLLRREEDAPSSLSAALLLLLLPVPIP